MADKDTGTALAPRSAGGPLDFGGLEAQLFSTFPKEERGRVVALMQGQAEQLAEMVGKVITVQHILAHSVETVTEDGEVVGLLRIVLQEPDGKAYATTSAGVRESIRLLARFYGLPPWADGLKVKVDSIKTRRGFETFRLSPVA
jgi:single-stranded DNA-binding protein